MNEKMSFTLHFKALQKVIHIPGTDLLLFLQPKGKFTLFDLDTLEGRFTEAWHEEIHAFEFYNEHKLLIVGTKSGKVSIYKVEDKKLELVKKFDDFGEIEGAWMFDENVMALVEKYDIRYFDVSEAKVIGTRSIGNDKYDPIKWVFWDQDLKKVVLLSFEKWFEVDY